MEFNIWFFLATATLPVMGMLITLFLIGHHQKMKKLELEALKIQKANVQNEVNDAVERRLKDMIDRVEVLEAIVTDKGYDLNEKITRLKS